jgi:hypothetical protein
MRQRPPGGARISDKPLPATPQGRYGHLIGTGQDRNTLFVGYLVGADAMIVVA